MQRPPSASLIPAVAAGIQDRALLVRGERVLVAVSGGPDSSCLLHCLQALRAGVGVDLHVAHVHHGLRGATADDDARFVQAQAAAYGLPFTLLHADVAALRRRERRSLQDAAREARYAALRALGAQVGAAVIATGHTADDQAETLILHLLRGSGIDGLAGMRPRQGDLVRPLLSVSHAAVLRHCAAYDLAWRDDASNRSRAYRRNALRLEVLPALEAYNPRIRETLARCATLLALDADYLRDQAARTLDTLVPSWLAGAAAGVGLALDRAAFVALPQALRQHVVRLALDRLLGGTERFGAEHIQAIDRLACNGRAGRCWQLPRRVRVEAAAGILRLSVVSTTSGEGATPARTIALPVPGLAQFGAWHIVAERHSAAPPPAPDVAAREDTYEALCPERVAVDIRVRARAPGDRMHPLGLDGSKKLQDLFVDRKVPRGARDQVPVVEARGGILWVPGVALDEQARLGPQDTELVRLRAWHGAGPRTEPAPRDCGLSPLSECR